MGCESDEGEDLMSSGKRQSRERREERKKKTSAAAFPFLESKGRSRGIKFSITRDSSSRSVCAIARSRLFSLARDRSRHDVRGVISERRGESKAAMGKRERSKRNQSGEKCSARCRCERRSTSQIGPGPCEQSSRSRFRARAFWAPPELDAPPPPTRWASTA